jgi:hypothetical protein
VLKSECLTHTRQALHHRAAVSPTSLIFVCLRTSSLHILAWQLFSLTIWSIIVFWPLLGLTGNSLRAYRYFFVHHFPFLSWKLGSFSFMWDGSGCCSQCDGPLLCARQTGSAYCYFFVYHFPFLSCKTPSLCTFTTLLWSLDVDLHCESWRTSLLRFHVSLQLWKILKY